MSQRKILIIEDNAEVRESIGYILSKEGYEIGTAKDGKEGLSCFSKDISLVVLDIMMPGMSGIEVCKKIRETSNVPILFLSAKKGEADRVEGLHVGGDDYLVKPFFYAELSARVEALLRRYNEYNRGELTTGGTEWLEYGELRVHKKKNQAYKGEAEIRLTDKEYGILKLLLSNRGRTFSAEDIYTIVWQEPFTFSVSNTVIVHIRRLRQKIEDNPGTPSCIQTEWGRGYRIEKE